MDTIMIDYEFLGNTAKEMRRQGVKIKVNELLAQAPKNDPFYCGAPSQLRDAEWFAEAYAKVGTGSVHLRRIHYRILDLSESERRLPKILTTKLEQSDGTKKKVSFEYYENYDRCWKWLKEASKYARWLNLVPVDAFIDNRAKEDSFTFNTNWLKPGDWEYVDPTPAYAVVDDEWDEFNEYALPQLPSLAELPWDLGDLPGVEPQGYTSMQQKYHVEIWLEKSEGDDVLLPLCRKYNVNLVPGVGDMSITTVHRFCQRVRQADRPAKILYISDFDPSGDAMPIGVARKLECFYHNHGYGDLDLTLEPVMLTDQQVIEYDLPPMPVKDSDARKDEWEKRYGGAVELNAMFARDERIAAARRIVENAILKYYDTSLPRRAREARNELDKALIEARDELLEDYSDDWQQLNDNYQELQQEWESTRDEFAELVKPFQEKIDQYRERLGVINDKARDTFSEVSEDLADNIDIDPEEDHPLPEIDDAPVDEALYHSHRSYWQQLKRYHQHKRNGGSDAYWLDVLDELNYGVDDG